MNVKISVFVICAEAIYLLLYNLHDCTLKNDEKYFLFHFKMVKHTQTVEKYFLFSPTKWSNTLKQSVGKLPTNCLSVFDHFVIFALRGLKSFFVFKIIAFLS